MEDIICTLQESWCSHILNPGVHMGLIIFFPNHAVPKISSLMSDSQCLNQRCLLSCVEPNCLLSLSNPHGHAAARGVCREPPPNPPHDALLNCFRNSVKQYLLSSGPSFRVWTWIPWGLSSMSFVPGDRFVCLVPFAKRIKECDIPPTSKLCHLSKICTVLFRWQGCIQTKNIVMAWIRMAAMGTICGGLYKQDSQWKSRRKFGSTWFSIKCWFKLWESDTSYFISDIFEHNTIWKEKKVSCNN